MDFFAAVEKRRSTRLYRDKPVDAKKLERLLETIDMAPSARNRQSYEIFIASTEESKRALATAIPGKDYAVNAPIILVFCAHPENMRNSSLASPISGDDMRLLAIEDAAIAASYCQLAATALGLATVWLGPFNTEKVLEVINWKEELIPIAIIPIGYPAERPDATPRRTLDDLVHEI